MKAEYITGILVAILVIGGVVFLFVKPSRSDINSQVEKQSMGTPYTEIVNPSGFVNSDGVTLKQLVGKKVIIVDFLTYTCINCQRTFPYLNAWYDKYKDQGLEIVGIHTPEFAFEKDINNVREAMQKFGIKFPIVLDNDYSTWNAYKNQYWPRKYIIDIHGNVVYDHIGEGGYEETEQEIQKLLDERAQVLGEAMLGDNSLASTAVPETEISAQSPETYFGSSRNTYLGNGTSHIASTQAFVLPKTFDLNKLYLGGTWNIIPEYAEANVGASVVYTYNAKSVYIVASADNPVQVEVWQDGKLVGDTSSTDVKNGVVTIKDSRLYTLINNAKAGVHTLELRVKGGGLQAYTFTFG
jgi:thiol-disulfide isomerase/thioredoxin